MSRKHHVKKTGSRSNYKNRLADRGLGKAPTMKSVEQLRRRQDTNEQAQILKDREHAELFKRPHATKQAQKKTEGRGGGNAR